MKETYSVDSPDPVPVAGHDVLDQVEDAVLAACRVIGEVLGFEVRAIPEGEKESDPLPSIARASGFMTRPVQLRGEWWKSAGGALLARRKDGGQPVALLPQPAGHYRLVDPATGASTRVDRQTAGSLQPAARMIYRPLPGGAVGLRAGVRWAFKGSRRDLATLLGAGIAGGLVALALPLATSWLFATIIPGGNRSILWMLAGTLVATSVATTMFQVTRSFAAIRLQGKIDVAMQAALWNRLLALPASFYRQYGAGDLASRALGLGAMRRLLNTVAIESLLSVLFSLFSVALLFYYNSRLAVLVLGLVGIIVSVTISAAYLQLRQQRLLQRAQARIAGTLFQFIVNIAKLRVAGAESRAFALWAEESIALRRIAVRAQRIANYLAAFTSASPLVTLLAIFAMVALSSRRGMSPATFIGFNIAFAQLIAAISALAATCVSILAAVPSVENIAPILATAPEVSPARAGAGTLSGDIDFDHVSFRYGPDGPLVLDDVTVRISAGEFVAFVGPSGSGKSTILRLLLSFETPLRGTISYDGRDLAELDPRNVRSQMGTVLQDGRLMPADILTNIVGADDRSLHDAWEAAHVAGLAEDIEQMPMGMYTVVSEDGTSFSGGQRQRLMLARALVARPKILLLDEATSALDNLTQAAIDERLRELQATRVVIAHRLSSIVRADRIYVLVGGRIVASGTFQQLLQESEAFFDLMRRQRA